MSLLRPRSRRELTRSNWLLVMLMFTPTVAYMTLSSRLYFHSDTYIRSLIYGLVTAVPITLMLLYRSWIIVKLGLHPTRTDNRLKIAEVFVLWLGMVLSAFSWSLFAFGLHLALSGAPVQTGQHKIAQLIEGSGKNPSCQYRVKVSDLLDADRELCVSAMTWKSLQPDQTLHVTGYFSEHGAYIVDIGH